MGSKNEKLHSSVVKLEAENASLKSERDQATQKAMMFEDLLSGLDDKEAEIAKWKALAEKANNERYGLLEVKEGLENQIATLKKQVEIARDFLRAEMIKSEPLSWAHEFCKVGLEEIEATK